MELSPAALTLFEMIDTQIENSAKHIRGRIFSTYKDLPWTHEQRKVLQPLLEEQLRYFVSEVLDVFDNVGGVIPDSPEETVGYTIHSVTHSAFDEEGAREAREGPDIGDGYSDYSALWREHLYAIGRFSPGMGADLWLAWKNELENMNTDQGGSQDGEG